MFFVSTFRLRSRSRLMQEAERVWYDFARICHSSLHNGSLRGQSSSGIIDLLHITTGGVGSVSALLVLEKETVARRVMNPAYRCKAASRLSSVHYSSTTRYPPVVYGSFSKALELRVWFGSVV